MCKNLNSRMILFLTQAFVSLLIYITGMVIVFLLDETKFTAGVTLITFVSGFWLPTPKRPNEEVEEIEEVKEVKKVNKANEIEFVKEVVKKESTSSSRILFFLIQAFFSLLVYITGVLFIFDDSNSNFTLGMSLITFVAGFWMPTPKRPKDEKALIENIDELIEVFEEEENKVELVDVKVGVDDDK